MTLAVSTVALSPPTPLLVGVIALSVVIGLCLGLLGGGGSILTIPMLTYIAGEPPRTAIPTSLVVVATTSAVAVIAHARAGRVRWGTAFLFAAGGMIGAHLGGRIASLVAEEVLLGLFAVLMLVSGGAMLRRREDRGAPPRELAKAPLLALGLALGFLTGLIGAGGGFVIVPALVVLGGLPMKEAVGTSLVVIALNSLAGLAGHLGHIDIDVPMAIAITAAAVVGSLIGARLSGRVAHEQLRRGFGVLVILLALVMLTGELI